MKRSEAISQIESLKQQLILRYSPEKIILFGSAATDEEEINDVDLFIIKDDVPYLGSERIQHLYRIMETDMPVDYLVYRPSEVKNRILLGDPFIASIFEEGKVLYG